MTVDRSKMGDKPGPAARKAVKPKPSGTPGWANGLRDFYSSVVDEPLPDAFTDLLRKLEDSGAPSITEEPKQ